MNTGTSENEDIVDMERLAAGYDAALNNLIERHGERLFRFLTRLLQNESDAEDLAQESFVRVYQHRARFDSRQKFSTWLYAIASNLARDRFRWRARHAQVSLDTESEETGGALADRLPEQTASPSQSIEASERTAAVREAVAALPEDLRLPLVLAEYEERPQAEIAKILDCSVKAVEMRIYRARQQLRKRLQSLFAADA
ncbi:MAG TPA: sigma-70 family RNA polymerase sigma factor [Candidatus Angelobacter sp.]|nr:sigma-70 family RNA polymerase sigma factor [Candidatus Angelobacter sp.]